MSLLSPQVFPEFMRIGANAPGNILGSTLFNTLAVVGIAGMFQPMTVASEVLSRDIPVMAVLTVSLFAIGFGFRVPDRINRIEGMALLIFYVGYFGYLVNSVFMK